MSSINKIIAIGILALIQQVAQASDPYISPPATTVQYADLDLAHKPGAKILYQRIRYAAEQVCSSFRGRDLKTAGLFARCANESVAASIAKIDQPVLTQYYLSKIGRSSTTLLANK